MKIKTNNQSQSFASINSSVNNLPLHLRIRSSADQSPDRNSVKFDKKEVVNKLPVKKQPTEDRVANASEYQIYVNDSRNQSCRSGSNT